MSLLIERGSQPSQPESWVEWAGVIGPVPSLPKPARGAWSEDGDEEEGEEESSEEDGADGEEADPKSLPLDDEEEDDDPFEDFDDEDFDDEFDDDFEEELEDDYEIEPDDSDMFPNAAGSGDDDVFEEEDE
ncbi:hypothetical protein [Aureliella helgolandensis]|uniref:Uncharacterized protein n=1 Tax=Aureliella helgolandensis TaxID=2527968 RepID=A0A518G201_9BACT|nr:hypothetical protein [Aureliella helgolandensis]QDV22647.1 hypothetical protein Q31a_09330 [Aureliella helgolandensis]